MMNGSSFENDWQRQRAAREEAEYQRRAEFARPANEALKEMLPSYHRPMNSVDHTSFEAKMDPWSMALNMRADIRGLEATIYKLESEIRRVDYRLDMALSPVTVRLGWRVRFKAWWRRLTVWTRREDAE